MKTIQQDITFDATPKELFELYMDADKHTATTGADAEISAKEGTSFSAWGGYITGKNIHIIKNELIVQTWRTTEWEDTDPDSIFILRFIPDGNKTIVHMIHADVPDNQAKSLEQGWKDHYWDLWKESLK